jgi:hypothetical protein
MDMVDLREGRITQDPPQANKNLVNKNAIQLTLGVSICLDVVSISISIGLERRDPQG